MFVEPTCHLRVGKLPFSRVNDCCTVDHQLLVHGQSAIRVKQSSIDAKIVSGGAFMGHITPYRKGKGDPTVSKRKASKFLFVVAPYVFQI